MEIVGGFMMMMSILGFFLAIIWLIMPFVVFAIKGKQDRMLEVLEAMEKRLSGIEAQLQLLESDRMNRSSVSHVPEELPIEDAEVLPESADYDSHTPAAPAV